MKRVLEDGMRGAKSFEDDNGRLKNKGEADGNL